MKPAFLVLPAACTKRFLPEFTGRIVAAGNTNLLAEPLLGLVSSRGCPGRVLLETLDRVPQWVKGGRVIISGFHSPLEQQVLRSTLRRRGRVVKVLARSISLRRGYHANPLEREALDKGKMLVISACAPAVTRTTRATALERNRLVLALATESVVPFAAPGSPLACLAAEFAG